MTETELAALDQATFVAMFGDIFEHSAWIATAAWRKAPFVTFEDLNVAMVESLEAAGSAAALALVRAHPDLAGKAALSGAITAESRAEQKASGLATLTQDELARFTHLNQAYKAKFDFPFVMAVRESGKHEILAAFEERLQNDRDAELVRAISEIKIIARLRLDAIAARP